jgi:hypothetical protein
MRYRIIDKQQMGTHHSEVFRTKEEIRQHLINYHEVDFCGDETLQSKSLEDLCDYGDWEIEEVK